MIQPINLENELKELAAVLTGSSLSNTHTKLPPTLAKEALARIQSSGHHLLQLKRVTIKLTEDQQIQTLSANNPFLSAFDIVAAEPTTEKLFLTAAQSTEIDLITLDATKKLNFRIKPQQARQAIDNGIMFEICFFDALRDSTARKSAISNARKIIEATKGQNVILSSGATDHMLLRGPYDLINLAHLFGLEASQARKALSQNPRCVVLHAMTRKTFRGIADIKQIALIDEHLKWTVKEQQQLGEYALAPEETDTTAQQRKQDSRKNAPPSSSMDVDEAEPPVSSSNQSKRKRKREE